MHMASNPARKIVPHHGVITGCAVVCRIVVGSQFSNNYQFLSLFPNTTHSHCTPRGLLIRWGEGPADSPLLGYTLLRHNANRGASTLAPFPASYDAHTTLLQVPCTTRQGPLTRWTLVHPIAPLRGFIPGLKSPPPCRPGRVGAYGSFRVYDPRHYRVFSIFDALWWPGAAWPPRHATTSGNILIRTEAQPGALLRVAVGCSVVVGSIFRNNYYPTSLFSPPPCPYTPWGSLTIGGSGPTTFPLSGYILQPHNADRGDSAILAPSTTSSYAAHATFSLVPGPSSLGAPHPRWTACYPTAPVRGANPGLRSPLPGSPGLVRAYGSLRIYDLRHHRVHSACLRPLPPTHRFDAARSAGPQPGNSLWSAVVTRVDIGTTGDCSARPRMVHTIQFGRGGELDSPPGSRGGTAVICIPRGQHHPRSHRSVLGHPLNPCSLRQDGTHSGRRCTLPTPTSPSGPSALRRGSDSPPPLQLRGCTITGREPFPPLDVPISPEGGAAPAPGHSCTADQSHPQPVLSTADWLLPPESSLAAGLPPMAGRTPGNSR